ncbi:MAG: hypothetical protein DMENIID0002_06360 [Rickettsia endosymbiont of Sergentomyia squamirostris]|uniref:120 kDa antigen n=1 Tax=Candidatus Tisiphia endosymbiont of Sergentomyia squamirostris TaxID=3113639 RepID=A0AAT9G890_9RICK
MKSYSFTSDDAAQNIDKDLQHIAESFDPKYDKDYQKNPKSREKQVSNDIERGVFYLETLDGQLVDLLAECKSVKGQDHKVTYQDLYDILTKDYHLSETQVKYILAANHQGGIAGGIGGLSPLRFKVFDNNYGYDPMSEWLRDGSMSKITIDKDHNVSYIGGQNFMFDCSMGAFLPQSNLRKMMGTKFNSQDYMAVNITASLGKAGDSELTPQVVIDVAGTGKIAERFISDIQAIQTNCKQKDPQAIIDSNKALSRELLTVPLNEEQYKTDMKERVAKIISNEGVKPETISTFKKANGATEALADVLIEQIDQAIATQKDKKTGKLSSQSVNNIAKEVEEQLNKFIDNPNKYTVKKFTKQLVNDQAASSNAIIPRKNFIKRICEYLKDKWHGYSDDKSKLPLAEQLKNEAKFVGQKAKSHMSFKAPTSPPPHNEKTEGKGRG